MKKLFYLFIIPVSLAFASCGSAGEEIPIRYGSERSELAGNPSVVKETVIDFEGVRTGRNGNTLSEHLSTYDKGGNILTNEVKYFNDNEDYRQEYTYNDNGGMIKYSYEESNGDDSFEMEYTWKGGLIVKGQYFVDGEPTNYYKYSYKGNRETSRSLYSSRGIKMTQTDYTWDGDDVVKVVEKDLDEDTEIIRTIERPDENTEIITVDYGDNDIYTLTVKYDENGNYAYLISDDNGEVKERYYSYQYDSQGNWIERTVKDEKGEVQWMAKKEFTYNS